MQTLYGCAPTFDRLVFHTESIQVVLRRAARGGKPAQEVEDREREKNTFQLHIYTKNELKYSSITQ